MTLLGLPILDIIIIVIYFAAMLGIGFWSMRRIKNQEDFFLGGRRFGKVIQIFANFGQATSSDTGPSVATTTYHNGAAGVWSSLLMLFATPFFWMTAPWYRRMRCTTLADFYEQRYNSKGIGGAYALISSIGLCILLSLGFIVLTKTVVAMTPKTTAELSVAENAEYHQAIQLEKLSERDYTTLSTTEKKELSHLRDIHPHKNFSYINRYILIISIVFVVAIYSVAGGLEAAFLSDMLQGIFIIMLSVMLIPFSIIEINNRFGGHGIMDAFRTLHEQKSAAFFEIFGSPHNIDFTWYYIAAVALMALITASAQANTFVTPSSSKDEYSARFGMTFGLYLKRTTTVLWGVTAMFAVLLYKSEISDPDMLWGYASLKLLGPLNLGLVGLMIAALMAALMSTADMMMITTSGLLTHNLYRPLFHNKSEKHYVFVGRSLGAMVVIGAAIMTLMSDSLLGVLKLWWEFGVIFAAAMWLGVLWKRTSAKAVWVQLTLTLLLFFIIPIALPALMPSLCTNPSLTSRTAPRTIERHYPRATAEDVKSREKEIEAFNALPAEQRADLAAPAPLVAGKPWSKTYNLPRKAIFWTKGVSLTKRPDGSEVLTGKGRLNVFLVLMDRLGVDLTQNPYALNETIRVLFRTFLPFLILIVVSLLTKRSKTEVAAADRMAARLLTPLGATPEEDAKAVEESHTNPARLNHTKLFGPGSNWQFKKWNKVDSIGFVANIGVVAAIVMLLYFFVGLGA